MRQFWVEKEEGRCVLWAPAQFMTELITPEDLRMLREALRISEIEVAVDESLQGKGKKGELVFGLDELNSDYTLESYYVGEFNRSAWETVGGAATKQLLPVVGIYSKTGLGKSHLLQGWARRMVSEGRKVALFSGRGFVSAVMSAFASRGTDSLYAKIGSCDILFIDDLQHVAGAIDTVHGVFFEVLNDALRFKHPVIFSSDIDPALLPFHERILSRLGLGPFVPIKFPDFDDRAALLAKIAARKGVKAPEEFYIKAAELMSSGSVRLLELTVNTYFFVQELNPERSPKEIAEMVLAQLRVWFLGNRDRLEQYRTVKEMAKLLTRLSDEEFRRSRSPEAVNARRAAVWLAVKNGASFGDAAKAFGISRPGAYKIYREAQEELQDNPDGELAILVEAIRRRVEEILPVR